MSKVYITLVGILIIILLSFPAGAYFANEIGLGGNARTLGLGGGFVAIANDGNALHLNPSGIPQLKNSQLDMMHSTLFNTNITLDTFTYQNPMANGTGVGLGFEQINYGDLNVTACSYTIGYGQKLNSKFYWGLAGKYHQFSSDLTDWTATGNSLDAGILYQVMPRVKIGIAGKNILNSLRWSNNIKEEMNKTVSFGVALENKDDYYTLQVDTFSDPSLETVETRTRIGLEKKLNELLSARAGWVHSSMAEDGLGSFSGGLSYHYQNWQVDYAYVAGQGELSGTHLLSATLRFDPGYRQMLRRTLNGQ